MKDYYEILGVSRYANIADIKRSFRRLANLYHPDKNKSPEAEIIIKEIIEAYQILSDPSLRAQYDVLLMPETIEAPVQANGKPHRDPRYRRQPRNPGYKSQKQQTQELMLQYMPYALAVSFFTLFFCSLLVLDFILPAYRQTENVIGSYRERTGRIVDGRVHTRQGGNFKVSSKDLLKIREGASITADYSRLLKIPLKLTDNQSKEQIRVPATIFAHFIFAPIVLLITSVLGVIRVWPLTFQFNLGIVNGLLFILNLGFITVPNIHIQ